MTSSTMIGAPHPPTAWLADMAKPSISVIAKICERPREDDIGMIGEGRLYVVLVTSPAEQP